MVIISFVNVKYYKHKPFYGQVIRIRIYQEPGRSYVRNGRFFVLSVMVNFHIYKHD